MLLVLFALWLMLEGQWSLEIALTGAVLSGLVYLFAWKFLDYSPRREWAFFCRLPRVVAYILYLVKEIFKAGFATLRRVWVKPEDIRPRLVSFDSRLKTRPGKVMLANSITLTPGTITVDVQEGKFLVHCLDEDFAEGLCDSDMEQRIRRIEG